MKLFLLLILVLLLPVSLRAQSWKALNEKVLDLTNKGMADSAIYYGHKALLQAEKEFGKKHLSYTKALNILGLVKSIGGDFAGAEPFYLEALSIQKELLGSTHADYIAALTQMAYTYIDYSQYGKAIPVFLQVADLTKQTTGAGSAAYAKVLENLAAAYDDNGEYVKSEPFFLQCLEIRKKIFGIAHPAYASVLNNLALLYAHVGRHAEAVALYNQSLEIKKKNGGEATTDYSITLNNLASLYCDMGEFAKAEPLYKKVLAIDQKAFGVISQQYARGLNNLATYYYDIGDLDKADSIFRKALAITEEVFGEVHEDVGLLLHNLGQLYHKKEELDSAEYYFSDAINVREEVLGKEHPSYIYSVMALAAVYKSMQEYKAAEELFDFALQSLRQSGGEANPSYTTALNNLATVYMETGKYKEAETLLLKALENLEAAGNEKDPDLVSYLSNLGLVYQQWGNFEKAVQLYDKVETILRNTLQRNFSFLSEQEKEKYVRDIRLHFDGHQSFYYDHAKEKPAVAAQSFNIELDNKGMILNSGIAMRQSVQNSGSKEAITIYNKWAALKAVLAREYALAADKRRTDLASLEEEVNEYEKQLTRLSSSFSNVNAIGKIKWNDVQATLKEKEVAVEFASFRYRNSYSWTDSVLYVALVLRKNDPCPIMISLCEAKQLDSLLSNSQNTNESFVAALYRGTEIKNKGSLQPQSRKLFDLLWKPLDHLLSSNDVIYFAPSGILHQIAFAAIPWDSATLLSDRYTLQQVSSTANLVKGSALSAPKSIALFGGIQYTMTPQEMTFASNRVKKASIPVSRSFVKTKNRGDAWNYLPGTLEEVNNIAVEAGKQKLKNTVHAGKEATEEIFKHYNGWLRHRSFILLRMGFFPDPKAGKIKSDRPEQAFRSDDNPLNRSGILLAGANRIWSGQNIPAGIEDGVLTAYEAGNLYFSSTQLVVLSACETGLGDIKGSEGVFGLQRAFKMAGAEYLMMSLWKVPDAETAEFMQYFYATLFAGKSIPVSFRETQQYMKKKYPKDPYKWAAFVLVK